MPSAMAHCTRGLVACMLLTLCSHAAHGKPPHIVFILADDLGWHDVGYHDNDILTPHLDQLAAEGVTLDQYYTQPVGSASRSQLMTGKYQIHLGNSHGGLRPDVPLGMPLHVPTIADRLRELGYATHAVGKWDLGMHTTSYLPTNRGFDTFYGSYLGSGFPFNHTQCHEYNGTQSCGLDLRDGEDVAIETDERYSTKLFSSKAQEIIQQHAYTKPEQPLFLYLAYQAPRHPLQVPAEYQGMYTDIPHVNRRILAGMMTCLDEGTQEVTDALKDGDLWQDTVLIFSSDNGADEHYGGDNTPLRGQKGALFEGGIRVPAFVHGDALAATAGTICEDLVHVTDWYPTMIAMAGGTDGESGSDGYNIWNTLSQGEPSPREEILHDLDILMTKVGPDMFPDNFDTRNRAALRQGDWKIVTGLAAHGMDGETTSRSPSLEWEPEDKNLWLFNISADPYETSDLSDDYPEVVQSLLKSLTGHFATAVRPLAPCPDERSNPALHNDTWTPWLNDEEEQSLVAICGDLYGIYLEFRYQPPGQSHGPGTILLVFIILVFCFLLFGTLCAVKRYFFQRDRKIKKQRIMDHE